MFGSGLTLRNWSAESQGKGKPATHVNVYDANQTKISRGIDREGMILVALMSGGDYIPEGIPGCGPKTACEAARAGYGKDLCQIDKDDDTALAAWKARLKHDLMNNEKKIFRTKHRGLVIPDDFPRRDILRYYTHPCVSSDERLDRLDASMNWDQAIDFPALRTFTEEAFEWICLSGAKKFIRNLAPAILVKELRMSGEQLDVVDSDNLEAIASREARLVKSIHLRRYHSTTDETPELRIGFIPHDLVPIDLSAEDPDPELPMHGLDSDEEAVADNDEDREGGLMSPKKRHGPSTYDPLRLTKIWILETYVKIGTPLKLQDWEESIRKADVAKAARAQRRNLRPTQSGASGLARQGIQSGSVDQPGATVKLASATHVVKGQGHQSLGLNGSAPVEHIDLSTSNDNAAFSLRYLASYCPSSETETSKGADARPSDTIDLISSSPAKSNPRRRFRRSQSDTSALGPDSSNVVSEHHLVESRFESILDLPPSVTRRRPRPPFRRTQSTICDVAASSLQLGESQMLSFRSPPELPFLPREYIEITSVTTDDGRTSHKSAPITPTSPPRQVSTPQKSRPSTFNSVIVLSSSPVETPATPRGRQRSITEWLTPSPCRVKAHTTSTSLSPSHATVPASTDARTALRNEEDPFLDHRGDDVRVGRRRDPLHVKSGTVLNAANELASSKTDEGTPSHPNPSISSTSTSRRIIRVRESLAGAWTVDHIHDYAQRPAEDAFPRSPAKKKRKSADQKMRWQTGQIEQLDLTEP